MAENQLEVTGPKPSPLSVQALPQEKIELLKRTICKGGSDDELELFLMVASRTGLDPFTKQIYAIKRWNSDLNREEMSHQIGIDGFRLVAQRTGQYHGQEGPYWCGPDGKWVDAWLKEQPPLAAKVGVLRAGHTHPTYAIARYSSYVQTKKDGKPTKMWVKMPDLMLAKCAEALALRKAFPNELSGLYTPDEMGQADKDVTPGETPTSTKASTLAPPKKPLPGAKQNNPLRGILQARYEKVVKDGAFPSQTLTEIANKNFPKAKGLSDLTDTQLETFILILADMSSVKQSDPGPASSDSDSPNDAEVDQGPFPFEKEGMAT